MTEAYWPPGYWTDGRISSGISASNGPPLIVRARAVSGVVLHWAARPTDRQIEWQATVRAKSAPSLMARIVGSDDNILTYADHIAETGSKYTIEEVQPDGSPDINVDGHKNAAFDRDDVFYDLYQKDGLWNNFDATGYNFRLDLSNASNHPLPNAHRTYRITVTLLDANGIYWPFTYLLHTV